VAARRGTLAQITLISIVAGSIGHIRVGRADRRIFFGKRLVPGDEGELTRLADQAAGLTATLTSVPTHTRPAQAAELAAALAALRWRAEDLDPRYPAHIAYAGNDHLILAARDRARLAALDYDYPALDKLMAGQGWTTVHLVWAESPAVFHARDPFPPGGVIEDPATGAAAAAFGGYLRALALVDIPARVTILQGEDMGRPSRLLVDLVAGDDRVR
jgi:PhzF family phenazine biosynthesis protein